MTDLERSLLLTVPKVLRTDEGIGEALLRAYAAESCEIARLMRAQKAGWGPDSQGLIEKAAAACEKRAERLRAIAERWPSTLRTKDKGKG